MQSKTKSKPSMHCEGNQIQKTDIQACSSDESMAVPPNGSLKHIIISAIPHQKLQLGCQHILQGKTRQGYT